MTMSKLQPNFTQTPNVLFDEWLPNLKETELKCLLYIMRHTYGFQKECDAISLTQFESGIKKRKSEEYHDRGTGLTRKHISAALKLLISKGIVKADKEGRTNVYSINLVEDSINMTPVSKGNQKGIKKTPKVVSKGNTQKKPNKTTKIKTVPTTAVVESDEESKQLNKDIGEFIKAFEIINPMAPEFYKRAVQRNAAKRMIEQFGLPWCRDAITFVHEVAHNDQYSGISIDTPLKFESSLGKLKIYGAKLRARKPQAAGVGKL